MIWCQHNFIQKSNENKKFLIKLKFKKYIQNSVVELWHMSCRATKRAGLETWEIVNILESLKNIIVKACSKGKAACIWLFAYLLKTYCNWLIF